MSDEAGSVSVSITGDLKPFEEALREVERRAEAAVKRIEAVTGKIRFAPSSGGRSSVTGVDELEAATKKAEQLQRSLTRELAREGNAQAAEVKRSLREQDRAVEESARKQAHLRAVLARDFKRASNEQIDDARRLAKELEAAQKPINVSRAQSAANAGQAKWNEWAGVGSGGSGDAARSANVFKAAFAEEAAARKKSIEDARAAASEKAKIDRAISESMKSAVNEEVASQRRAAAEKKAIYDKEVADRKRLLAAWLEDSNEQAAINRRIAAEEAAAKRGGMKAGKNKRFLASQASYQLSDVISGLAMGQSPTMIATQQGGQIYDLFQRGGGVKPTLEAFGSALKFAINPIFLATASIAGLGLIAGTAAYKFDAMMRGLNNSTQLGGRSSGATASSLYGIASRQKDLSTSEAAGVVGTFASAGVDVNVIGSATDRVKKFAQATSQDAGDAAKELASALADPAKGVDDLAKRMGGFDVVVVQNVKNLSAQGDKFAAQKALADAFGAALDKANIEINKAAAGWGKIGKAISDIYNSTGKGISAAIFGMEDQDKLEWNYKNIERLEKMRADNLSRSKGTYSLTVGDQRSLDASKKEVEELEKRRDAAKKKAADDQREADIQAKGAGVQKSGFDILGLTPKQDLTNQAQAFKALETVTGSVAAAAKAASMSEKEFTDARDRATEAAKNAVSADEKLVKQGEAAIEMIKARTVEEKILAAQMAIRAGAINTTENTAEKERQAAAQAIAASQKHADDMLRSANDNAASAGMFGLAKTIKDIETRYAREIELSDKTAVSIRKLTAAREAEKAAAIRDATAGPTRDATFSINEQVAATRIQAATFGAGAAAIAEATKRQELYNQYAREGVTITPELASGIDGIAKAAGKAAKEEYELNKSQKKIMDDADHLRDAGGGFMKTFLNDLAKGKSAVEALKDAINSLMQKLLDRVEDNLIDMILGKKGSVPGGADDKSLLGGIMGSILGSKKQGVPEGGATGLPTSILPTAKPDAGQARIDQAFGLFKGVGTGSNYRGSGVDPRLTDILTKAAETSPYKVDLISGLRQGDPRFHGKGMATDVSLIDKATGRALPNYQNAESFRAYEQYAQDARRIQMRDYPELNDQFRWGGYFGGPKGKYGAVDQMHFDIGGAGMAGGSWGNGLTSSQRSMFPGIQSQGMDAASESLSRLQAASAESATKLTSLGTSTVDVTQALTGASGASGGASGGGGLGGLLSSIFSMFKFSDGGIMTSSGPLPLRKYADGGVANTPQLAMFGEGSSPEAYVPLKNGGIPVRISGPKQANTGNFAQTNITVGGATINVAGDANEKTLDLMRQELDVRDRRMTKDLNNNFGNYQRHYSALRAR